MNDWDLTILDDGLRIAQPRSGYRFSEDSVTLANFITIGSSECLLDLCSGVGVIPLLLRNRLSFRTAVGIERDPDLVGLARLNVQLNGFGDQIQMVQGDVRKLADINWGDFVSPQSDHFDVVSANPPYWPIEAGRLSPNAQKTSARHEVHLTLSELIDASRLKLKPGGRFYLVQPGFRERLVRKQLQATGYRICRLQSIERKTPLLVLEAQLIGKA
ncbi:MAG: methyltransferase domain-containing protein [Acidobacteriota bacterium]